MSLKLVAALGGLIALLVLYAGWQGASPQTATRTEGALPATPRQQATQAVPPTEVPATALPATEVVASPAEEAPPATEIPATALPAPTHTAQPTPQPSEPAIALPDLGPAPELANDVWINSDTPLRLADLRGKVVVVEFWTYGCYNCQNVLPYVRGWHERYGGDEFTVVSIHYPEFNHERDYNNVLAAVREANITYPVAIDNEGATWRAYSQHYWPTWYVVDKQGHIRYKHIGEGGYEETEAVIQTLLTEAPVAAN